METNNEGITEMNKDIRSNYNEKEKKDCNDYNQHF